PARGRGRSHECALHGRPHGGAGGGLGSRSNLSDSRIQPGRKAFAPAGQGGISGKGTRRAMTEREKTMNDDTLDQLSINTIRTLAIDAVQQANSGHPGAVMALAPAVYTIWNRVMRFDPLDPIWPNRDRFVLSNGHASMLLWSLLHLTGTQAVNAEYETLGQPSVSLDDIRRFRQLN